MAAMLDDDNKAFLIIVSLVCSSNMAATALFFKAGTHEGACSSNTLPQHAPGAKLPQVFTNEKFVAQQNVCSNTRAKIPSVAQHIFRWYTRGSFAVRVHVAGACCRSKPPRLYRPLFLKGFLIMWLQPKIRIDCLLVGLPVNPRACFDFFLSMVAC